MHGTASITNAPPHQPIRKDNISGTWKDSVAEKWIEIKLVLPDPLKTQVEGIISYSDGGSYPLAGFTDIFAETGGLNLQGITFSTYVDGLNGRICITMAGYLNLSTNKISLTRFSAQSTQPGSTWQQVIMQSCHIEKKP